MSAESLDGGCLCGAIRFRVTGPWTNACFCHCRSCRLASGAPFVAWASVPPARFRVTRGSIAEVESSPQVVRGFCGSCGSSLTYTHRTRQEGELDVALATLDEPSAVSPECHLWVSEKLAWIVLGDGLPAYAEWRQGG